MNGALAKLVRRRKAVLAARARRKASPSEAASKEPKVKSWKEKGISNQADIESHIAARPDENFETLTEGRQAQSPSMSSRRLRMQSRTGAVRSEHSDTAENFQPWRDEYFHRDDNFIRITGQKGPRARARLGVSTAVRLEALNTPSASAVAAKLRSCEEGNRCGSGACPPCTAAVGHWSVDQGLRLFANHYQILFTTIQLTDATAMPKRLTAVGMEQQKNLLTAALTAAGLGDAHFFGAMDISRNVYKGDNPTKRWSIHSALFCFDRNPVFLTRALTNAIKRNELVAYPVKTKIVTVTPEKVLHYAFKNSFYRRITDRDAPTGSRPKKKVIGPKDPLFPALAVELDRIGLMARIYLHGIKVEDGKLVEQGCPGAARRG